MRKRLLAIGTVTRDHFMITGRHDAAKNGHKGFYFGIKCTKCGTEYKGARDANLSYQCIMHNNYECTASPYKKKARESLDVGDTVRNHFLITSRDVVEEDGKKSYYVSLKCKKCGTEIKHVRNCNVTYYCRKHDYEDYTRVPRNRANNRIKSALNVGDTTRDHFLITNRNIVEKNGKTSYFVDLECQKCGVEIKHVRTSNITYYCRIHDYKCKKAPYNNGTVIASK